MVLSTCKSERVLFILTSLCRLLLCTVSLALAALTLLMHVLHPNCDAYASGFIDGIR